MLFNHAERARIRGETIAAIESGSVDLPRMEAQLRRFLAEHVEPGDGDPAYVDADAFKSGRVGVARDAVRHFHTAGRLGKGRGTVEVSVEGLTTMRTAILRSGREMAFGGSRETRILALAPPPNLRPRSLMTYCMELAVDELGARASRFLGWTDGIDVRALTEELRWAEAAGPPLTLLGPRHVLIRLVEDYSSAGVRFQLPPGSRIVDTGVVVRRRVPRRTLIQAASRVFGIPQEACIGVLGMTELASQFYEPCWRDRDPSARWFEAPPWVRTWAIDRHTGAPVAQGEAGFLVHSDLAILDRPFVVVTDDVGRLLPPTANGRSRFELLPPQF